MKKLYAIIAFLALVSCSSDEGPPGPPGPEGPPGEPGLLGTVFEVEGDLTADNGYLMEVTYSDFTDVEIFESDVVLVYRQTGTDGEAEGEPVYVWKLLPQTIYPEGGGTVQYNFDYTFFETHIYLESTSDLSTLPPEFTDNQVFRIAILPAEFAQQNGVDVSNYEAVMRAIDKDSQNIPVLDLK